MPRNSDTFWSRVLFKDFIRHFRKMSPEQIAEDITESMDALDDLNPDGDSFGSLMVRWANERMNGAFATAARENGKKGGRPRKQDITEDAASGDAADDYKARPSSTHSTTTPDTISTDDNALREGDTGPVDSMGRTDAPSRTLPLPTWESFLSFVDGEGLDYSDAREWWEMTMVDRKGYDRNGKPIGNWMGALKRFCTTKKNNRRTA
jgi:hypothetical protein